MQRAAARLTGHRKRLFRAEVAVVLCGGSARRAERRFGWGRDAVTTGLHELASGIRCVEDFAARGRVRSEDADPRRAADIRELVEPSPHAAPELKTDRRYTDLAARGVLARLRTHTGYTPADLPSERAMRDILNRMGYRLTRVRAARPLKKTPETDAIFAHVRAARAAAAGDPEVRESSVDTKAKVAEGAYVRGGKTRAADGTGARGWDHDPPPARTWTPVGVPVLATGALSLFLGPRETSPLWADGLGRWWESVKGRLGHVRRLVVYLDNGPNGSGTRTQFLNRMAAFADASGRVVRLVYYPPYHSTYHPVERCGAARERKWRGGLRTRLGVIPGYARRMTWQGKTPTVDTLVGGYPGGVKLSRAEMRPVEARLARSKTLPKYDITIRPKTPNGR